MSQSVLGKVIANDSVNLTIEGGKVLCLLGENGSGKTTLMNVLSGIYMPEQGHILKNGVEIQIRSPKDAFANGIGMDHQHFKAGRCPDGHGEYHSRSEGKGQAQHSRCGTEDCRHL